MVEKIQNFIKCFSAGQIAYLSAIYFSSAAFLFQIYSGINTELTRQDQENQVLLTKIRCVVEAADRDIEVAGRELDYLRRKLDGETDRSMANVYGVNLKKLKSKYALNTTDDAKHPKRGVASVENGCGL